MIFGLARSGITSGERRQEDFQGAHSRRTLAKCCSTEDCDQFSSSSSKTVQNSSINDIIGHFHLGDLRKPIIISKNQSYDNVIRVS